MNKHELRTQDTIKKQTDFFGRRFSCGLQMIGAALAFSLGLGTAVRAADLFPLTAEQLRAETHIQRQFSTKTYLADVLRAERVTYALAKAGAPYCVQRRKYSLGIPPLAIENLPEDLREGFADTWQTSPASKLPQFLNVISASPAGQAGVRQGDILLKMIDQATGKQVAPGWTLNRPRSTLVQNESVVLEIQRGAVPVSVNVAPQPICDVQLKLLRTNNLVARVEGGEITLSQGTLRFVANDDELAYLIANELVHDQLRSTRTSKIRITTGKSQGMLDPADEQEADYLGAYLIASAQFDIERAKNIWRRIASLSAVQSKEAFAIRHPLPPSRAVKIQAVSNEILRKAQTGERQIPSRGFAFADADFRTTPVLGQSGQAVPKEDLRLRQLTSIPFIDNEGIAGYQRFLDSPLRPRAFAIGPSKTSNRGAWSFRFGTNAAADALAYCSTFARGPCYLYAVDDRVVWNPETAVDQPQANPAQVARTLIGQPRGTGFAVIGDLAAVPLPAAELPKYRAFLEKPSPRAFIITQEGQGLYWIGPAAMHDALTHCARLGTPCWLYAVNNDVIWSKDVGGRISHSAQLPVQNDESGFLEN